MKQEAPQTVTRLRVSPEVLVGFYVDERKGHGAALVVSNNLVRLDEEQVHKLIAALQACLGS